MSTERLAELLVRDTEHCAIAHPGQSEQCCLDLCWINVNPAGNHHVVLAVAEKEVAVLVEVTDIADRDKPVALDIPALLGQPVIGEIGNALQPDIHLANFARRQLPAEFVINADGRAAAWSSDS